MRWTQWKMGLFVAVITGVCTAFAVGLIVPGMTLKEGGFILAASVAKDLLLFLKDHPVSTVTDQSTTTQPTPPK